MRACATCATPSFVWNLVGKSGSDGGACGKGRGGSSLPECCYSGPHASASVSANERNSALFHLVSPDRELASPKTDAAREGRMDGWREEDGEGESWRNRRQGAKTPEIKSDGQKKVGRDGGNNFPDWGGEGFKHKLPVSHCLTHTHAGAY